MKGFILSAIPVIIATVMSSCDETKKATNGTAVQKNSSNEILYQKEWKLTEVQGEWVTFNSKAMMMLSGEQENKVTGSTGCNRMTGTYELSGTNTIKFSPLAITRMACLDENANSIEQKFINALSQTNNWSIDIDMLILKKEEVIVAKLKAQSPATAEEVKLNGTWELNYISGPRIAFDGLFPNKKPTIIFNFPNEEATGSGSCNGYSVKVKAAGNKINFGDALHTMMACEGNGEPLYFKTLKTITSYSITGNTLTMMMGDIAVMRFAKK